jgi:hypothetical protein
LPRRSSSVAGLAALNQHRESVRTSGRCFARWRSPEKVKLRQCLRLQNDFGALRPVPSVTGQSVRRHLLDQVPPSAASEADVVDARVTRQRVAHSWP